MKELTIEHFRNYPECRWRGVVFTIGTLGPTKYMASIRDRYKDFFIEKTFSNRDECLEFFNNFIDEKTSN